MLITVVFAVSLLGALIQGITGFGAAILIMCVLPFFMPVLPAGSVTNIIILILIAAILLKKRKYVRWKLVILPSVLYFIGSTAALCLAMSANDLQLKRAFGMFLITVAVYLVFFSNRITLKTGLPAMIGCGFLAGFCQAAFGAGSGPIFVLYCLNACQSKDEYLGTVQACLLVGNSYLLFARAAAGMISVEVLHLGAIGAVGAVIGSLAATAVGDRLSDTALHRSIYGLIAVSGAVTLAATF